MVNAQNTVLLQSRDAKVPDNALSAISSICSGLDDVQGYLFSKYTLLPLLVLLREAHTAKISAAAAVLVTRPQPALPALECDTGDDRAPSAAVATAAETCAAPAERRAV